MKTLLNLKKVKPIKFTVSQIEVVAGRPDLNVEKMLAEIEKAKSKKNDVILFSEMVVPGYLLGDEWENDSLIKDLMDYNDDILKATQGITVIWGNIFAEFDKKGEDGRIRKYNAVYIAQNGKWISNGVFEGHTFKTLMPKYREFDDERHFYSMLKLANERKTNIESLLQPFKVTIDNKEIKIGIILCEDMWCDDYTDNPTQVLVKNGADVIVNLSCSPWTWRKNDKRNRVVKSLLTCNPVPFLYCNNTGIQNNGKNIFLFDGNSTVYAKNGEIVAQARDYNEENIEVELAQNDNEIEIVSVPGTQTHNSTVLSEDRDTKELYDGLTYGIKRFFDFLGKKPVVLGLSRIISVGNLWANISRSSALPP